ncbi:hypothetical protein NL676_012938 [Syzygium grande]|nr:hypothetical protein NL676_012938 [Syzygium grande]
METFLETGTSSGRIRGIDGQDRGDSRGGRDPGRHSIHDRFSRTHYRAARPSSPSRALGPAATTARALSLRPQRSRELSPTT